MTESNYDSAERLIRAAGASKTEPRITVLTTLLGAQRALTHRELEQRVRRSLRVDRVTVYRVLEWLVANGLAHRIAGDDRIWRFNAVIGKGAAEHAHFKCNDCSQVICIDDVVAPRRVSLPAGYRAQAVEITVKGLCAVCSVSSHRARRRPRAVEKASRR